jgi:hypothetical protein
MKLKERKLIDNKDLNKISGLLLIYRRSSSKDNEVRYFCP